MMDGQMVGWMFGQVGSDGCIDEWIDDCLPLGRIPGPIVSSAPSIPGPASESCWARAGDLTWLASLPR